MSLRIKNIALSAWFLLPLDERVREIVVLAAFAPGDDLLHEIH